MEKAVPYSKRNLLNEHTSIDPSYQPATAARHLFADTPSQATRATGDRPNVIVILTDDMGYGDLGCYGNTEHATPHIDQLAEEGVRLTDFYMTSPVCTPSRVALMTGRHPGRVGFDTLLWPTTKGGLPTTERTLPKILREQGYVSSLVGKWHLGHSEEKFLPLAHGFDEFYGMPYPNDMGPDHYQAEWRGEEWPPMPMMRDNETVEAPVDVNLLTQQYTAEAVRFLSENHHKPFFLYLSHAMPHTIIGASPDFRGSSKNGLYGDAVQELDWSIGEIRRTLRALGQEENTLIVFASDNGAVVREMYEGDDERARTMFPDLTFGTNAPLRGGKVTTYEGGVRVPGIVHWPAKIKGGQTDDTPTWVADVFPTVLDYLDIPLPADRTYDGVSLKPHFSDSTPMDARALAFGGVDPTSLRYENWKLVLPGQPAFYPTESDAPMLYNLAEDIAEANNLADTYPERTREMLASLKAVAADMHADTISR